MKLLLFDIDGTLIRSFLREGAPRTPESYDTIEVLPGRLEKLDRMLLAPHNDGRLNIALVTNQAGVAFGYQTVQQVTTKMGNVCQALGLPIAWIRDSVNSGRACNGNPLRPSERVPPRVYVSFGHPDAKIAEYAVPATDNWRKPGAGMIRQAMTDYGTNEDNTLFIGDMDTDAQAAHTAGIAYLDADAFFA